MSDLVETRLDGNYIIRAIQVCCKSGTVRIHTETSNTSTIDVLVMQKKLLHLNLLLGIDAIKVLGGIHITQ